MKIQFDDQGELLVLRVEGRLAGAYVPELECAWNSARSSDPRQKLALDLKGVTCVDRAGRHLLQLMHNQGVEFRRPGIALQDILDEIAAHPHP